MTSGKRRLESGVQVRGAGAAHSEGGRGTRVPRRSPLQQAGAREVRVRDTHSGHRWGEPHSLVLHFCLMAWGAWGCKLWPRLSSLDAGRLAFCTPVSNPCVGKRYPLLQPFLSALPSEPCSSFHVQLAMRHLPQSPQNTGLCLMHVLGTQVPGHRRSVIGSCRGLVCPAP